MKWFDRWFAKKVKWAWDNAHQVAVTPVPTNSIRAYDGLNSNGLNLTVYQADGGKIIEFRHYDPVKDRNMNSLHVITEQEDFAERLSQIITMEIMRNGMR